MELILEKELQNFEPFKGINFLLVKYTVINYLSKLERILHIPYNPVKKVKGFYIYLYHKKAELIGIKKLLNGISPGNTIINHKDAKKMVHDIVKLNTFLEHVHYFHQRGLKKELKLMISDAFDIEFLIRKNTIFKNSNYDSDQELIDFANDISMNNYRSHNESI